MYYEVYLDVLFVLNVIMDYFMLRILGKLLGKSVSRRRSFLGACLGAGGICILALHPLKTWLNMVLVHGVINTLMVRFGCNLKRIKELLRGTVILYGAGFLLGGMMEFLRRMTGTEGVINFLLIGAVSDLLLEAGVEMYRRIQRQAERTFRFVLYVNGHCREGRALLDTGNGLRDTVSRKPVNIGTTALLGGLLTEEMEKGLRDFMDGKVSEADFGSMNPHYLPFTGLGCSRGTAVAVTMDYLCLESPKIHKVITRPVIAFSGENNSFAGDYQMILHPDLMDSEEEKLL